MLFARCDGHRILTPLAFSLVVDMLYIHYAILSATRCWQEQIGSLLKPDALQMLSECDSRISVLEMFSNDAMCSQGRAQTLWGAWARPKKGHPPQPQVLHSHPMCVQTFHSLRNPQIHP